MAQALQHHPAAQFAGLQAARTADRRTSPRRSALRCPGATGYSPLDRQSKLTAGTKLGGSHIGVRYWEYLPQLFSWPADRDHNPCPFGAVYQLGRNALAATATSNDEIDLSLGHTLIVYDSRNPAFNAGGKADRQWEATLGACLVPGLLRRISWQHLAGAITPTPELSWLVEGLRRKYGIVTD
jgi:hypothetical protein